MRRRGEFRLTEVDLLKPEHFPVQAIFNMLSDDRFIRIMKGISEGHGFGENYGACTFPDDLDEYDIATTGMFEGVEFGLHNGETVILDYQTLYYYLEKICNGYIEDFPQKKEDIDKILAQIRSVYQIQNQ